MNKNLCWLISTFNIEKQNLLFFSSDVLAQFIRSNQMDENRRICIAESIIRWFLNREDNLASIIDEALPDGEREQLGKVLDENFPNLPSRQSLLRDLWNPRTQFSVKCMANVRKRLIELCCDTDGFIPVYTLPITCIGRIFPLHKKPECSAPPPRCCLWDSVSPTATPQ